MIFRIGEHDFCFDFFQPFRRPRRGAGFSRFSGRPVRNLGQAYMRRTIFRRAALVHSVKFLYGRGGFLEDGYAYLTMDDLATPPLKTVSGACGLGYFRLVELSGIFIEFASFPVASLRQICAKSIRSQQGLTLASTPLITPAAGKTPSRSRSEAASPVLLVTMSAVPRRDERGDGL